MTHAFVPTGTLRDEEVLVETLDDLTPELFARLERPIDFEAMDGQPVDLVFLLLAPEGAGADHLKALARIARLLRDQDVAKKLRASRDAQAIYSVLASPPATAA